MPSPNSAPYEWYDLLAEDAIQNVAKYNLNLDVDKPCVSQRQSPEQEVPTLDPQLRSPDQDNDTRLPSQRQPSALQEQWNSVESIPLTEDELVLFQHYVAVVGPILDLCDPTQQFSTTVPRLAVHNLGLLKSLLAVGARHLVALNQSSLPQPTSDSSTGNLLLNVATQYYYETLHYLSQNLSHAGYSKSREIIATALLISSYEMFDAEGQYNNDDLTPDELCLRIVYICGRCVDFAAAESVKKYDVDTRVDQGKKLTQALNDWYSMLGSSFQPIYKPALPAPDTFFSPIWIHPPSYAAAIQTFHFSRIIVTINEPSPGGMEDMRQRQRLLDDSVETICGIASTHQGKELPSAMINVRALYAAGLAVRDPVKQAAVVRLLDQTLDITKFPPKSLLEDLATYWRTEQ
ncbi:hypothetical protein N0V95_009475 [Ascochyta clinopodiicola]|nr:hypothetical protein N0V95_009475 [Ascochyta clinopodiicola]